MSTTRRSLLRLLAAIPFVGIAPLAKLSPRKFGFLTALEACKRGLKLRVTVDGVDVTHVCFEADDVNGYAECFLWESYPNPPAKNRKLVGSKHVERITLRGNVVIEDRA